MVRYLCDVIRLEPPRQYFVQDAHIPENLVCRKASGVW